MSAEDTPIDTQDVSERHPFGSFGSARAILARLRSALRRIRIAADIRYLRESGHFDTDFYLRANVDVASAGLDPIAHYVEFGVREGRRPRADFDAKWVAPRRANELPRNPFVLHLRRMAARQRRDVEVAAMPLGAPSRAHELVTRSSDTVRYGSRSFSEAKLFSGSKRVDHGTAKYHAATKWIADRLVGERAESPSASLVARFGPRALAAEIIASRVPDTSLAASGRCASYAIITAYAVHGGLFRRCAQSVARLMIHDLAKTGARRVEWIIAHDDPQSTEESLMAMVPSEIRAQTRVLRCGERHGIASRLNDGIDASRSEWVVLLDCEDVITSRALDVLDHYSAEFPYCRYIASPMITDLVEVGETLDDLACIRRDLFESIGKLVPRFSGCHAYELALRVSSSEPILQIPEHLRASRRHGDSPSTREAERHHRLIEAIERSIARALVDRYWPEPEREAAEPISAAPRGVCLVRTRGTRLERLAEALASIARQTVPTTACVIVHGDAEMHARVSRFVSRNGMSVVVLHAPDQTRPRGYALNLALDHVEANAGQYDFFCSLEDDDILYSTFAERLCAALDCSAADVAFGTTNARGRDGRLSSTYPSLPPSCLTVGNVIPLHGCIVRTSVLTRTRARFSEALECLEDWDFLLSLLDAGARFYALPEALSERRAVGDGDAPERPAPEQLASCSALVRAHGERIAKRLGAGAFFRDILELDLHGRPSLTEEERELLSRARRAFGADTIPRGMS